MADTPVTLSSNSSGAPFESQLGLSDLLSAFQNGVVALNDLRGQLQNSFPTSSTPPITLPIDATNVSYTIGDTGGVQETLQVKLDRLPMPQDFGAVGDGSNDDTVAMQAWLDVGGALWLPRGGYKITAELIATVAVTIFGAGRDNCTIFSADGVDCKVLTLTLSGSGIYAASLQGSQDFGAANATLTLALGCNNCHIENCFFQYGRYPILNLGTDNTILNNEVRYGYGSANVKSALGGGGFFIRNKMDQSWPVSNPAINTTLSNWTSSNAYAVGDIARRASPAGNNWIIQCTASSGVSSSAAPTLLGYEQDIFDRAITWHVACPETYFSYQMDSGATEDFLFMNDHSGAFSDCIGMTNTGADGAGSDPNFLWIQNSICGQQQNRAVSCVTGSNCSVSYSELNIGWGTADAEMLATQNGFVGKITVSNNNMIGGNVAIDGIKFFGNGLANLVVSDNRCTNPLNAFVDVDVGAGSITDFSITDNITGSNQILVGADTNWFVVMGNNTRGAGVNIASTGANFISTHNL